MVSGPQRDTRAPRSASRRVVHVTEALGGGVLTGILDLATAQARDGIDVSLLYSRRPDTPDAEALERMFAGVLRATEVPGSPGHVALAAAVARLMLTDRRAAVHLHSSVAGAIGRAVALALGGTRRTLYSPHGFAFLRHDVSRPTRWAVKAVERALGPFCAGVVLVSNSEYVLAAHTLRRARLFCVENVQPPATTPALPERRGKRPLVIASGRIAYQKAPWRFAEAARAYADRADFVWIGDGPDELKDQWLGDSPLRVTGWLAREEVMALMADADIMLHGSLWEGLPYSLLEGRALGIPCVASRVVGNIDAVVDGVTGVLFDDTAHMLDQLELLLDPETLHRLRVKHHQWLATYEPRDLSVELARVYGRALASR